jgi:type IV pilus assembly protein PilC
MLFSSRLPLPNLIELCRVLRHYVSSGLTLVDVFRQQAKRGLPRTRPVAARVARRLEAGETLEDALDPERAAFPPLFLALAGVGEQTGNLPEVFGELERYYLLQRKLRQTFLGMIAWPLFQLNAAIFVVSGLILILGIIASPGTKPFDPLGMGVGEWPALRFLLGTYGTIASLIALYFVLTRALRQKAAVDQFLLAVPVIGPCLRALSLTRFCLALGLTTETGMSITKAVGLSLRATGNAAFTARTSVVLDSLRHGVELTEALAASGRFPESFLHILGVAEESGRISEEMLRQSEHYADEAARQLTALTMVAGWGVWLLVAVLIIYMIFRIFLTYISMLDPANYGL